MGNNVLPKKGLSKKDKLYQIVAVATPRDFRQGMMMIHQFFSVFFRCDLRC
jgi:hypothetical protein